MRSNISSLNGQRGLARASENIDRVYRQLSSGLRINRASDDAAGLAIASSLGAKSRVYSQAIRNGNDATSAISIAEGALGQLSNVVIRIKELAEQSANGTFSRLQRLSLDDEAESLMREFNRITTSTSFNGLSLLNGDLTQLRIQLGFGLDGGIGVGLGSGLRRATGTGEFYGGTEFTTATGFDDGFTAAGDLNGDGYDDIIAAYSDSGMSDYRLQVRISNGDGTFQAASTLVSLSESATMVRIGDFDGDGRNDVAVGLSNSVRIYRGNGSGGINTSPVTTNGLNSAPSNAKAVDVNNDGKLDLIWQSGSSVDVLLGQGNGNFQTLASFSAGGFGNVAFGDINGDGQIDIAQANGASGLKVFLGSGSGRFNSSSINTTGFTATSIAVADMNYDGLADIVASGAGNTVRTYLSTGSGTLTLGQSLSIGTAVGNIVLDDFNGDGIRDIVVSAALGGSFRTYFGYGDGLYNSNPVTTTTASPYSITETADFNGDGVRDALIDTTSNLTDGYIMGSAVSATSMSRVDLTNLDAARSALGALDGVLARIQKELGILGAAQSRIGSALNTLMASRENSLAAAGRIQDADIAEQSALLVRNQILQQAASGVLAQANQAPALALTLLNL